MLRPSVFKVKIFFFRMKSNLLKLVGFAEKIIGCSIKVERQIVLDIYVI